MNINKNREALHRGTKSFFFHIKNMKDLKHIKHTKFFYYCLMTTGDI